jgi:hypothetical protein
VQREPRVIVRTARGSGGYVGHVGYLVENPGRVPDLPIETKEKKTASSETKLPPHTIAIAIRITGSGTDTHL